MNTNKDTLIFKRTKQSASIKWPYSLYAICINSK